MSTRCQLAIYKNSTDPVEKPANGVFLYRHSDGYPDGVVPDILEFLRSFEASRGISDSAYASARLMAYMVKIYDEGGVEKFGGTLGHGIDIWIHSDIEYFYHISPIELKVLRVTHRKDTFDQEPSRKWELVESYPLRGIKKEVIQ